ncbi:MAG TPA: HD domain-containing protein [Actinobacteria bacterium]|nr:HD domain-containing protein [Actinomycetota bacterium]
MGCHIIHLADRIAVLTSQFQNVLEHIGKISEKINKNSGNMFVPEYVEAFNSLASKKSFWLNSYSFAKYDQIFHKSQSRILHLDAEGLLDLARLFCQIIDFRSRFTATHSSGVAATVEAIAENIDFSQKELLMIKLGGYLHDLGKLAVPVEILEKPGRLTQEEFSVIQSHTYYSFHLINLIPEFAVFNEWAAFHHETMDGHGYPFEIDSKSLTLGSRLMAVADVFTALTEDRPYRAGMSGEKAIGLLKTMVAEDKLDGYVVNLVDDNKDEINSVRLTAQKAAYREYQEFSQLPKAA